MADVNVDVDVDDLRARFVGVEFHRTDVEIRPERALAYAEACGDDDPRYRDPAHPDFQVHPTYIGCLGNFGAMNPKDFPDLGKGRSIDGGKSVDIHGPIRMGDVLSGRSEIAEIYTKTGRSGTMMFIVHRMNFYNQRDEPVATVDLRQIKALGG
ncbi:MAG: MaoC family dehydratase N-terminal domain-containing protein [Acidimicrobiales bacterium]